MFGTDRTVSLDADQPRLSGTDDGKAEDQDGEGGQDDGGEAMPMNRLSKQVPSAVPARFDRLARQAAGDVIAERAGRLVSTFWFGGQCAKDDGLQFGTDVRRDERGALGLSLLHRLDEFGKRT